MNHFEAIEKLLTRGGWKPVRTCGNLRQYKKAGNPASLVLPVPDQRFGKRRVLRYRKNQ